MKYKLFFFLTLTVFSAVAFSQKTAEGNPQLAALFNNFYEENLKLSPLTATSIGDNRYNDQLPIMFTEGYRQQLKAFYAKYLAAINGFNRGGLSANDQLSYDVFKRNLELGLRNLKGVTLLATREVNPYHLLGHKSVFISEAAARKFSEALAK